MSWKEGKLAQREEGTIVIRVRTQCQAGLGCSEPWPSPLLPFPLSPAVFLAYACHVKHRFPPAHLARGKMGTQYCTCTLFCVSRVPDLLASSLGRWAWQLAKKARFPPSTVPPRLVPRPPSLSSIPRNKGQSLRLRQGSLVFSW